MEFVSPQAEQRYADLVSTASRTVVCLDFDGVLSPIVEDPSEAYIHPRAGEVLLGLAAQVQTIAVVTGRPARQAVALGRLDEVGARVAELGKDFHVLGQYGNERWSAATRQVVSPRPPKGLANLTSELPGLLRREGLGEAHLEQKSLAIAVHTRRLQDPVGALERLQPVLEEAAARHGLVLEPGRMVVEIRAPGTHQGIAVRTLQKELRADAMMFVGDDLGDIEAFRALASLRQGGMVGLLVCSASEEQPALREMADIVVDGPDGVMDLLARITSDAATTAASTRAAD